MLAPRLRIFAGPNGSGKSTIKELIPSDWLGIYINADEIEKTIREIKTDQMPAWFKTALWDKFDASD
jgi:predicted ABC-type ATPase